MNSPNRKQNLKCRIYVDHIRRGKTPVVRSIRPTQMKSKQGLFYESSDLHTSFHTVFMQCFHKKPSDRHLFILPVYYIPQTQTNLTCTRQCSYCAILLKWINTNDWVRMLVLFWCFEKYLVKTAQRMRYEYIITSK